MTMEMKCKYNPCMEMKCNCNLWIEGVFKEEIFTKAAAYADNTTDDKNCADYISKNCVDFLTDIILSYLNSIGLTDITFHKVEHKVDGFNNFDAINIIFVDKKDNTYTVEILRDLSIKCITSAVDACEDILGNCSFTTIAHKKFMINKTINFDLSNISIL